MCTWAPSYGEDGTVEVELATGTSKRVSGLCREGTLHIKQQA
jgi:hypothetical protein